MRDAPPSPPATKAPDAHEQASFRLLAQQRLAHGKRLKLGRLSASLLLLLCSSGPHRSLAPLAAFFRDALRFRGSVLLRILPTLFAITLWAFAIAVGNLHFGKHWHTSNAVIGPLSVVFGLL
jgi:putative membrane protein